MRFVALVLVEASKSSQSFHVIGARSTLYCSKVFLVSLNKYKLLTLGIESNREPTEFELSLVFIILHSLAMFFYFGLVAV